MKSFAILAASMGLAEAGHYWNRHPYAWRHHHKVIRHRHFEEQDATMLEDALGLNIKIGNGICQAFSGYDFYNLQKFDQQGRDKKTHTPVSVTSGTDSFVYKACQPEFTLQQEYAAGSDVTTCSQKGNAYWISGGKCAYSFDTAEFDPRYEGADDNSKNVGFNLKYTSNEKCGDKDNFKVKIKATCGKDATATGYQQYSIVKQSTCEADLTYLGPEACATTINLQKYMDKIAPYIGFIMIAIGIVMTFYGSKFVLYVFSFCVFALVTMIVMLLGYNLVLSEYSASMGPLIATLLVACAVGAIVGVLAYKFARGYAVSIIAAWAGIAVFVPVTKLVGIHGTGFYIGAAILGAVVGFILGKKFNNLVQAVGTALIGSYFTTRGLGTFIGGYPSETDLIESAKGGSIPYNPAVIGYFLFMVFLTVLGSYLQIRWFGKEAAKDEFEEQDESKRCGCF